MKPFLLLATRPEDAVADGEYELMLRYSGLRPEDLVRVRLEAGPMPDIDLGDLSGIIVGGSPFTGSVPESAKSDTQLRVEAELAALLDVVVAEDFPFLGACYGIGTLARHQGGEVDGTYAEPISAPVIELTDAGRDHPLCEGMQSRFRAFVGHKEAARTVPPGASLLATSENCPVQMFQVRDNLFATQFHPELDAPGILLRIDAYRLSGYFDPAEQELVEQAVEGVDARSANRLLANFVSIYRRS
ncbi:Glutamine amidotransferase class-I [Actinomycetales bacterium JB111]|nr:Glutamine amidotransferase class-I [Actinomycetales bacterium JB111]